MAASDPDTNMEGDFVGQATKDNPALASVDASNPTRYKIALLLSHVGAQWRSNNTLTEVLLCQYGVGACTLSSVLTKTVEFRAEDLHGANNGLGHSVSFLDAVGPYNFQLGRQAKGKSLPSPKNTSTLEVTFFFTF